MRLRKQKIKSSYHYSSNTYIRGAYKKALLVIDSCENEYHFEGAKKYLNNFIMMYSTNIGYKKYETDTFVLKMFDSLKKKLFQKKLEK